MRAQRRERSDGLRLASNLARRDLPPEMCGGRRLRAMLATMTNARWTRLAVAYFLLATASLVWPLFSTFGNHVEPRVFGMPWSLCYVLGVVTANAVVLLGLYFARVVDSREVSGADGAEEHGAAGGRR